MDLRVLWLLVERRLAVLRRKGLVAGALPPGTRVPDVTAAAMLTTLLVGLMFVVMVVALDRKHEALIHRVATAQTSPAAAHDVPAPVRERTMRLVIASGLLAMLALMSLSPRLIGPHLQHPDPELVCLSALPIRPATYQAYRLIATCCEPLLIAGLHAAYFAALAWSGGWRAGLVPLVLAVSLLLVMMVAAPFAALEAAVRRWTALRHRWALLALPRGAFSILFTGTFMYMFTFIEDSLGWHRAFIDLWAALARTPAGIAAEIALAPSPGSPRSFIVLAVGTGAWALAWCALAGWIQAGGSPDGLQSGAPRVGARRDRPWSRWLTPLQRLWAAGPGRGGPTALSRVLIGVATAIACAHIAGVASVRQAADWLHVGAGFAPGLVPGIAAVYVSVAISAEINVTSLQLERGTPILLAQPARLTTVSSELAWSRTLVHAAPVTAIYLLAACLDIGHGPTHALYFVIHLALLALILEGVFASQLAATSPARWSVAHPRGFGDPGRVQSLAVLASTIAPWMAGVLLVFAAANAYAARQELRHIEPFLADPDSQPPHRIRMTHALTAVNSFFVLQAVCGLALGMILARGSPLVTPGAFAMAGGITVLATLFWVRRTNPAGWPGLGLTRAGDVLGDGIASAVPPLALAYASLVALHAFPTWFDPLLAARPASWNNAAMLAMAVIAAPLCEEVIFRGLLFGSVRHEHGLVAAVALSTAVFALCHPPASFFAVSGLGVACALARERTGGLAVPMAIHAVYNLVVMSIFAFC